MATAGTAWAASHLFGMLALITLPLGVAGVRPTLRRSGGLAATLLGAGGGIALPYYGGETFGAAAVAELSVAGGDAGVLSRVEAVRWGPLPRRSSASACCCSPRAASCSPAPFVPEAGCPAGTASRLATTLMLFVPQFFAPPWLRIAHGLLLAVGCLPLARGASRPAPAVR